MATSGNGLKFLWVPGKKKHNRKGQYSTTKNHHNPYKASNLTGGQGQQRKQEAWTLGGSRGHRQLVHGDSDDFYSASASTSETACTVVANGAAIVASTSKESPNVLVEVDEMKSESPQPLHSEEGDEDKNEELKNLDKSYHNASTLVLGEKNKKSASDDLDSIEPLGESKSDLEEHDVTDTASTANLHTRKRRTRSKSKKKKHDPTRPEDDKLVACLYYSLVCCDCSIS